MNNYEVWSFCHNTLNWEVVWGDFISRMYYHRANIFLCINRLKVINFSMGFGNYDNMSLPMRENNVMCWIQVSASKLFRIIIVAITDNSDKLAI